MTRALWSVPDKPCPVVVAESTTTAAVRCAVTDVELVLVPELANGEVLLGATSTSTGAPDAWLLSPRGEADVATSLLLAGGAFRVLEVRAAIVCESTDGEAHAAAAELELALRLDAGVLARPLDATALPAAARAALDAGAERARYPLTADPEPAVPSALARCRAKVCSLDFSAVMGGNVAPTVVAAAVVDDLLLPIELASRPGSPPATPLPEVLAALGSARVLVELSDGERQHVCVLRADQAWLWGSLSVDRTGAFCHRSSWHARRAPASLSPPTFWPGTLTVRDVQRAMTTDTRGLWEKIAWTPLALAADLCFGWLWYEIDET